jgi:acyl carrier protein
MSTTATYGEIREAARARLDKNMKIKTLIIDRLGLEVSPEVVSDNQPLFGRGLEMDSLDSLEIVVMVNNEFGVSVNDDDIEAFGSINALVDFVEAHED